MHGLKVHVAAIHYKGSLWDSELSSVTEVTFMFDYFFNLRRS